ncbi:MAG: methyltransferase [Nanoarchaeota archaeon]|nr:methyltransferase [Nanoarchaeota archaeon]
MKQRAFNLLGSIALVNFPYKTKLKEKKDFAKHLISTHKNIKTVLEKVEKFSGRLRKQKTKLLIGENTKEVLYKENNCEFRFNIEDTYFSPRLANERMELAKLMKKDSEVLVMFAGVAPFSIVIAKNSKVKKVYSNEINRKANKYAELNIEKNKLKDKIELVNGDIKKVVEKLNKKFDTIIMPRPQLKDSFLEQAFKLSKKGTIIYYYDFCKKDKINSKIEMVKQEAKKAKKKIKIIQSKSAGELAPYKIRLRIDLKVLN